jgi:hypothetical protein
MVRWERGADRLEELIARGELQRISGGEDAAALAKMLVEAM